LLAQTTSSHAVSSKSSATHKKSSHAVATKPAVSTAKPAATTVPAARHSTTSKKSSTKKPVTTVARRSTQQQPTPDRYREIQQALADKGYLAGSPDGNWSSESVEALKHFQRDQNLAEDGKIGSLSLIAMGLGPHRPVPIEAPTMEVAPAEKSLEKSPGPAQQH
jgi:peptidoglycan hydrolase-like protein with peptidoglycan-binding domain